MLPYEAINYLPNLCEGKYSPPTKYSIGGIIQKWISIKRENTYSDQILCET